MIWIVPALCSAIGLGFYDVMKKLSVRDNNVPMVLWFNTLFSTLLLLPALLGGLGSLHAHLLMLVKATIVLSSWILGYYAIKHLPLTIQGPINASRPVLVLVGAVLIFGERLNLTQWSGILLGFLSLLFISRLGRREGDGSGGSRWILMSVCATSLGAVSALYDKYLMSAFEPLEVQAWYSFYQLMLMTAIVLIMRRSGQAREPFSWRWAILGISVFITLADMAYFYSLSLEGAMISVVSMIRRGSVLVSFAYGAIILHEKHLRLKLMDLTLLLISLILLILGSK